MTLQKSNSEKIKMNGLIQQTETNAPLEVVGGKARGLLKLKSLEDELNEDYYKLKVEVPSFFVVPPQVNLRDSFQNIMAIAESLGNVKYAVRSSSQLEDVGEHSFDGIFDTQLEVPREKLVRTIQQIRKSAKSDKARKYADDIGIDLIDEMPVIVQAMVDNPTFNGVVYSKFPCPTSVSKMIRKRENGEKLVEAFPRLKDEDGRHYAHTHRPIIKSKEFSAYDPAIYLVDKALDIEDKLGYPIILEFAYSGARFDDELTAKLLQARKLTKLTEAEKFQFPQLNEKGLVAQTKSVNGVGDVTALAYVVYHEDMYPGNSVDEMNHEIFDRIAEFDKQHKEGYILVTPFLQFYTACLDDVTPHKKGVIASTDLGEHHDFEVARKKDILYLGFNHNSSLRMDSTRRKRDHSGPDPIETGDSIRIVSDGLEGYVYNLSK